MALSPRVHIKQTQQLVITPLLMQAIRLLQMPSPELTEFVDSELQQNPLLLRREDTVSDREENPASNMTDRQSPDYPIAGRTGALPENPDLAADAIDVSAADMFPDAGAPGEGAPRAADGPDQHRMLRSATGVLGRRATRFSDDVSGWHEDLPGSTSLVATIEASIAAAIYDPKEQLIALTLLADLDEAGYLGTPLSELAENLGAGLGAVESVLRSCQNLAPAGVFARSLKECLALQLAERDRLDPAMSALLDNLQLLAERRFDALCEICGVDRDDLEEMIAEIKELDPKPAQAFTEFRPQVVVADIFVRPAPAGGWAVELNEETLPRVLVDRTYCAEIAGRLETNGDRKFLSECLQRASWLEKSLDQRARTILKVATEIVRQQGAFLEHGVTHLRPLNLRTVAESTGMHESTISRATANKFMATPRGIFELKYFFSSSLASADGGDSHSAEAVKHRIRRLIDNEWPDAILSDDAIAGRLRPYGIVIARRTVAKYRDLMHIPSSAERRREKQASVTK